VITCSPRHVYFTSINRLAALNVACERENAK